MDEENQKIANAIVEYFWNSDEGKAKLEEINEIVMDELIFGCSSVIKTTWD